MTVTSFFFSAKGRISRSQYWLGMAGVAAVFGIAIGIALWTPFAYAAAPFILVAIFSTYILAIKRLHDRNKSGWWTLVFLWGSGTLDRISNKFPEDSAMWWALSLAALGLGLWGLIEMGFLRGTDGDNDYGADPLGHTGEVNPNAATNIS
jgi:uncharacterized membrane protein YhaH (DUF805 family)